MAQIYSFLDMEPFDPAQVRDQLAEQETIPVRRPLYGLEISDETHATLQVLQSPSSSDEYQWRELLNSSVEGDPTDGIPRAVGTANLIITSVKYSQRENIQLVETFADSFLYAFGSAPVYLQIQAVLLKSKNFPWRTEWLRNYSDNLRAGRTVDASARAYMTVEDTIYEGHIIACDVVDQAESPTMSPLQFIMYLTNVVYGEVGGAYHRRRSGAKTDGSVGTTRASSGEYILGGPEHAADREYAFDEQGNLVLRDVSRLTREEVDALLAQETAIAARLVSVDDPTEEAKLEYLRRVVDDALAANALPEELEPPSEDAIRKRAMLEGGEIGNLVHSVEDDPDAAWLDEYPWNGVDETLQFGWE